LRADHVAARDDRRHVRVDVEECERRAHHPVGIGTQIVVEVHEDTVAPEALDERLQLVGVASPPQVLVREREPLRPTSGLGAHGVGEGWQRLAAGHHEVAVVRVRAVDRLAEHDDDPRVRDIVRDGGGGTRHHEVRRRRVAHRPLVRDRGVQVAVVPVRLRPARVHGADEVGRSQVGVVVRLLALGQEHVGVPAERGVDRGRAALGRSGQEEGGRRHAPATVTSTAR
jgi:hypothetical protein